MRWKDSRTFSLTKDGTKVTMTTPPFSASRRRTSSGTLRGLAVTANAEEWEKMTGASDSSSAWCIVRGETWERSTSMPSRFISRITRRPNAVNPPCAGWSVAESAHAVLLPWVKVM